MGEDCNSLEANHDKRVYMCHDLTSWPVYTSVHLHDFYFREIVHMLLARLSSNRIIEPNAYVGHIPVRARLSYCIMYELM